MQFKDYLETLTPLQDYEVEIILNNGEKYLIENKPGKQGSLRIIQNHLGVNSKTSEKIDLEKNFLEYFQEWKSDNITHPTIGFLDRFNNEGGEIRKVVKKIPFVKSHGTGNDFIILDFFDGKLSDLDLTPELIQKMCDRNFGIGSDGILIVQNGVNNKFAYRMFNPDGSEAEMCGNGIRCYMKYLVYAGLLKDTKTFVETKKGVLHLSLVDDLVEVDMGKPILVDEIIPIAKGVRKVISSGSEFGFTPVSMGNPHAVIFLDNKNVETHCNVSLQEFDLNKYGKPIESNTDIFPKKVNVEFIKINSKTDIDMRVFERGAGETLACGTGACASVVAGVLNGYLTHGEKVTVHLKGGDLVISWAGGADDSVIMRGTAEIVFEGEFII
ncbi:MAG: diaminopimelate epimerase [Candidatus Gracilibacteria bacterium]|nr:diaminopimelate epimerase [Candidatus Gracilibacteria bacterium]